MKIAVWLATSAVLVAAAPPTLAQTSAARVGQRAPVTSPQRRPGTWAQLYAGRPADSAVRFGQLGNGLRYAIQRNDTPKAAVSMRMLVGSGSLSERDEERGLAHYIEHMAFRGSANIADGDVVRMLERQGLQFGADTNAFTSFDKTVYQFDFPKADATAIDTGLTLFREIGGRLKLDPAAVAAERGVILSEERLRASGGLKAAQAQLALTLPGTRVAERFPIGTIASLNAATPERLRRFYDANYRPENTTIVIVGAIDPDAIEAQLKSRFGDWRGTGPADPRVAQTPAAGKVMVRSFTEPGVAEQLALTWTRSLDQRADTTQREQERALRTIALTVLNQRLRERSQTADAPFSVAGASANDLFAVAETTTLMVIPTPGKWREALAAAVAEQRRLAQDGITATDVARALNQLHPTFQAAAEGATTRTNPAIANAIVASASDDEVYTSPGQDLAAIDRIATAATPATVTAAYREAFAGTGPFAFRTSSDPVSGDDAALTTAFAQARAAPLATSAQSAAVVWPYASFGTPGRVVTRTAADAAGMSLVTFANGTRLAVMPTKFSAGGVSVRVQFGDGLVGLRPDQAHAAWLVRLGAPAFFQGGTTKLPWPAMQRVIEGRNVSLSLAPSDTRFILSGETRAADLAFQAQLLAAYYHDAAFAPDGVTRIKGLIGAQLAAIDSNTLAVMTRALGPVSHNGDARWKPLPDAADVTATTPADLAPLLRDALQTPVDVIVTGDVTVDDAIAAVGPTFAALPRAAKPRSALPTLRVAPLPGRAAPYIVTHSGRADQAVVAQLWSTPDYYAAPADAHALAVVKALLFARLIDTVREKLGLTYSPFVSTSQDLDLAGQGYLFAGIEVPPAKFDEFRKALTDEVAALATTPITPDALTRAKAPLVASRQKARETNAYWSVRNGRILADPRAAAFYASEISGIESVTAADVQRVLRRYVVGKTPLSLEVRAEGAAK